ncbi:MAG: DUF4406 domain-containing protein [Lachnospiraceae bacterium]|nr:DUF4406 domain-containing protein [Lachnospiraceae bacterium]
MKKLVYISHPSSGLEENTKDIEKIIRTLYKDDELFDNFCFVSPVHCYGFMYHETEYYKGLSFCTDLLEHCDMMLVFGDWENSTGCTEEVRLCKELNIPYLILGHSDELDKHIKFNLNDKMLKMI